MWNNLRARHYSVLILLAIVALETSAIAIDRLVFAESEEAFAIESSFQNNSFIQSFRMADANCAVLPVRINNFVSAQDNNDSHADKKLLSNNVPSEKAAVEPKVSKSVSADFVAAAGNKDNYTNIVEYDVQPGDSLSNIAELFGTKAEKIKQANKLDNKSVIKAGQTIKVPTQSNSMVYTVKKGDSLSKIANRFNVSIENLVNENSLKSHVLLAEQKIKIPVDNRANLRTAKVEEKPANTLPIVKTNQIKKAEDPKKLQLVKLDTKLPTAPAAAPAKKVEIDFTKDDFIKKPAPVVAKADTKKEMDVETVELNLSKTMKKASTARVSESKNENEGILIPAIPAFAKAEEDSDDSVEYVVYKVAKGDNLSKIASKHNTTVAQIQNDNGITGDKLSVGQSLKIKPNQKLYRVIKKENVAKADVEPETKTIVNHKVQNGESLSIIAKKYNTTVRDIVNENNMTNTVLMTGQTIKVPEKKKKNYKITTVSSKNTEKYAWKAPTKGWVSSPYGWRNHPVRKKRIFHAGLDLAAPKGTAIYSVAPGRVIFAGTRGGYGKVVIIAHENGLSTRYGHCSKLLVKNGQLVKEGQLIAKVGATGVATGNHLHFEVRKNGKTQNPINYIKLKN
ncbi:MAG: LysM peptidoglycan-binding domain-containing protein [Candidatus Riflebacteria bacterium]|nr:LysM peptidoglycan-binding domain-containing protein [Candidatus Riflebacteria bacterium]